MRSWRDSSRVLVAGVPLAFLGATVILVAVLAWQAYAAAASHRALAERVLHDYADLAATEFVRRSTSFVGNYGFGAAIRGLTRASATAGGGTLPSREAVAAAIPSQSKRAIEFIGAMFRFDIEGRRFETDTQTETETATEAAAAAADEAAGERKALGEDVRRALLQRARAPQPIDRQVDYRVLHLVTDGRTRSFVFTAEDVGEGRAAARLGFEVRPQALAQWFKEFILPEPLLPPSLASRDAAQSAMRIAVRSPDGRVLVQSPDGPDKPDKPDGPDEPGELGAAAGRSAISTRRALGDPNENSLADFSVDVAIDPSAAHRLVIGGLPDSRVGLLLSLLVLALGLGGAAVVQVGRERALAQLREDFVTRVSHELRTPVARIRMFAETLLLDRLRTDDERRRSLEAIDRGSRRLAYLIENVMQFSQQHPRAPSRGASLTEPTDLRLLAQEVIEEFEAMTDTADATDLANVTNIEAGAGATLANVDRESFRQILTNLLDNATKYAARPSPGTRVTTPTSAPLVAAATRPADCIRVEIVPSDDRVELRVIDRGPGIPERDRERVWRPYVRLDRDRRSAVAGAGIGLAVVRDLVARDGGRCWIEDTPGGGATVIVTFAAAQASRADERRENA